MDQQRFNNIVERLTQPVKKKPGKTPWRSDYMDDDAFKLVLHKPIEYCEVCEHTRPRHAIYYVWRAAGHWDRMCDYTEKIRAYYRRKI